MERRLRKKYINLGSFFVAGGLAVAMWGGADYFSVDSQRVNDHAACSSDSVSESCQQLPYDDAEAGRALKLAVEGVGLMIFGGLASYYIRRRQINSLDTLTDAEIEDFFNAAEEN